MVRGQEQMDMSAIDKSLDEIISENNGKRQSARRGRGTRGRGARGGRYRGRGRGNGMRVRQTARRSSRGRGARSARGSRLRQTARRTTRFNTFNRRPFNKRSGVRGGGRSNAPYHRRGFGTKPLHRPSRSGINNTFTTQGKVVVSNLKKHVSSDDIKEIFEKFGTVTQAFVNFDASNGSSTGTAQVFYSRGAEARQAQKELDGAKIDNGVIRVRLEIPSNFSARRGISARGRRSGFGARFGNRSNRGRGRGLRGRGYSHGNRGRMH